MKNRKIEAMMIVFMVLFLSFFGLTQNVNAAYSKNSIYDHLLINNYPNCYHNAMVSQITAKNYYYKKNGAKASYVTSLLNSGYTAVSTSDSFYVPTLIGNNLKQKDSNGGTIANCQTLLFGDPKGEGSLKGQATGLINSPPPNSEDGSFVSFMHNLGYEEQKNTNSNVNVCISAFVKDLSENDPSNQSNGKICFNKQELSEGVINKNNYSSYIVEHENGIGIGIYCDIKTTFHFKNGSVVGGTANASSGSICDKNETFDYSLIKAIDGKEYEYTDTSNFKKHEFIFSFKVDEINEEVGDGGNSLSSTIYNHKSGLINDSIKALSNGSYNAVTSFSDAEKYQLYLFYLGDIYGYKNIGGTGCQEEKPNSYNKDGKYWVWLNKDDGKKWCSVNFDEKKKDEKVTVFAGNQNVLNGVVSLDGLLKEMFSLDYSKMDEIGVFNGTIDDPVSTDSGDPAPVKPTCANSGAANSLGWIVCPLLDWMATASKSLYDDYVEPALQVSPKLFTENQDDGVRYAWGIFQGIANTLFIIMLLIVIFSQLTGVGIDNYGIKKIMPKLIVAAILINLSYPICLAAVDLSNIFGNALQALFNSYQPSLNDITMDGTTVVSFGSAGMTLLTGVVILGGLAAGVWGAMSEEGLSAIALALLIGALTVVIAIFSLFLLLAVREAAIVVLVVASPLAFACYMLPNTKSIFDKWYKFMKGLLLVYPICGLLVGGGNFVSKLLLSSGAAGNGFFSAFMAMVIGVVPIFLIPTVLKGSIAAMGKLGDGILRMGNNVRGGMRRTVGNIEKGIKGSERYKNNAAEFKRNKLLRGNERTERRLLRKQNRNGELSDRDSRRLARSRAQLLKQREEDARVNNLAGSGYAASLAGIEAKMDADRVSNAEAMLQYGKVGGVNTNDAKSMSRYLEGALGRYRNAANATDKANALAEVKAAQNIMSKTDAGRGQVQSVYENALRNGNAGGLNDAASHLVSNYGDKYKTVNRGFNEMISDLAKNVDAQTVAGKVSNGSYDKFGVDKYTEETLAGADGAALERLVRGLNNMTDRERSTIQATASRALTKMQTGNLNVKPEVARQLEELASGVSRLQQMHNEAMRQMGVDSDNGLNIPHDNA